MPDTNDAGDILSRALDQTGAVLAGITPDQLSEPTPCSDWDVAHLAGHVIVSPANFTQVATGGQPDWLAEPEPASGDFAERFRNDADDLLNTVRGLGDDAAGPAGMATAELAVHSWDLARATGQEQRLDPTVAERAYAFMSQGLTPENRGVMFGEKIEAPDGASPYDRLAAFAGRQI